MVLGHLQSNTSWRMVWEYKHPRKHHEVSVLQDSVIHNRKELEHLMLFERKKSFYQSCYWESHVTVKKLTQEHSKEFPFSALHSVETYLQCYKWGKATVSQVLAGQACLSSPSLKGDQKMKYDIKLISIVISCPRGMRDLQLYSLLIN